MPMGNVAQDAFYWMPHQSEVRDIWAVVDARMKDRLQVHVVTAHRKTPNHG